MSDKNISRQEEVADTPRPVTPNERIDSLDVLRGIAILGVLVAYTVWNLGGPPPETYGTTDRVLSFVLGTFLNTKAYTLLAFLFGLGFSIQLSRAKERGADIVALYLRRLIALMLIGFFHALLLRNGDILVPYAAVGFVLLLFRNASNRVLVIGAIAGAALPFFARWVWEMSGAPFPTRPETVGMGHIASNLAWVKYWYATAITVWPEILPMFLCGLYVGRKRIMENLSAHRKKLRRVMIAGFIIGAVVYAGRLALISFVEWPSSQVHPISMLLRFSWSVHAWGFAASYAGAILLLMQKRRIRQLAKPLAAVGRMSLTNYLSQAVIIVPICIAFDLYDKVTPSGGLLLALGVALFQIPMSVIWLRFFRFGPAEWLWRSITYKEFQRMVRDSAVSSATQVSAKAESLLASSPPPEVAGNS